MLRLCIKPLNYRRIVPPATVFRSYKPFPELFRSPFRMNSTHRQPLNFDAGPLVWIDCEMTGLNPKRDKILEVAVRFMLTLCVDIRFDSQCF
jgi:DNA polymerase III epsilon subunit-like protein